MVVINSDSQITALVRGVFSPKNQYIDELSFVSEENEIYDTINYELPDFVIVNFSVKNIPVGKVLNEFNKNRWLLSFGILGVFDSAITSEEEIFRTYKDSNILSLMENYRIESQLRKTVQLVEDNYQLIFQREISNDITNVTAGSFTIENDIMSAALYAGIAASMLIQRDLITADTKMHLQMALEELLVNAIEHGNCAISFEEKTKGMAKGKSVVDLVTEKCRDPRIAEKRVDFQWEINKDTTTFTITDQGKGFDVKAHLAKVAEIDFFSQHGRGIKMASKLVGGLKYNARGNRVSFSITYDTPPEHEIPPGFEGGETVLAKPGQIILTEGMTGSVLYYIVNGEYAVYHKEMQVGLLTQKDIFAGEMGFLLGNHRTATVIAVTEGKLIKLTRRTLVDAIKKYPQYGLFLSKLLAKRLARSNVFRIKKKKISDLYV
jgi:anti-sigma regulatory factor (Ser/Thr protein kinase)